MAAKSTLKNMVLCLGLVCFICAAVLGGTYVLTAGPIEQARQNKTRQSIAKVLPEFGGDPVEKVAAWNGTDYTYYAVEGTGCAVISTVSGFGGPLSVMVGIVDDGTVYNTVVLSQSETPGLGAKCQTDAAFTDQFKGWDPASKTLLVKKDGGDVDAITASTITSRAYALAISNAIEVFKTVNAEGGLENEQ